MVTTNTQVDQQGSGVELVQISQDKFEKLMQLAKDLETAEPVMSVKSEYYDFGEKGANHKIRGIFYMLGTTFDKDGKNQIPCAYWLSQNKLYHNAAVVLVQDYCRNLKPGTAIEIEYLGKRKGTTGIYDFNVQLLRTKKKVA